MRGGGRWLLQLWHTAPAMRYSVPKYPPCHEHYKYSPTPPTHPLCSHLGIGESVRVGLIALGAHGNKLKRHAGCHPAQHQG